MMVPIWLLDVLPLRLFDLLRYLADVMLNNAVTTSKYLQSIPPDIVDCLIEVGKAIGKVLFVAMVVVVLSGCTEVL